ncbi:unnamed protein product [Heligmosomoides polygyrus]|uniref:GPI transamidase component PIG-S n=1 Tax=Heligmosomoides polygyrus TaxID=6339 RepID=A0A3P7Y6W6_HELPZ|nr:unnamed protein product [Heligmosomoides polygyrus]
MQQRLERSFKLAFGFLFALEVYHEIYMREELPYRRAAALAFIVLVLGLGAPLWYRTTSTYRAPFDTFPKDQLIPLTIQYVSSLGSSRGDKHHAACPAEASRRRSEVATDHPVEDFDGWCEHSSLIACERKTDHSLSSDSLGVYIAFVPPEQWTHFSAVNVFLSRNRWIFVQYTSDKEKLVERVQSLIWEVLVDVPHLNAIVKRDMRERLQPWQIAALSPSHQKRLVWDSAPLSMNYIVQVIHVHDNNPKSGIHLALKWALLGRFSRNCLKMNCICNVLHFQLSSEHLWDFEVSNFLEADVQGRRTLSHEGMERLLKEKLTLKLNPLAALKNHFQGEDSRGAAVASWGAVVPRIAALRILLGVDSELPSTWKRATVPLTVWETDRMRLRAILDNAMRAMSAVRALKALTVKITNVVIGDDVAARANQAVQLVREGLQNPEAPGRFLADEALSHPSLLAMLYFPKDQTMAVYLPIMLPTLIPLFGSIIALSKWALGWS